MRRLLSLYILFMPGIAFADEAEPAPNPDVGAAPRVEEVVVSATRSPQLLSRVGASLTVISGEVLHERQIIAVSDAIAQTPGVTFSRNGGPGGTTALRIRGAETDQTVVVINGVKMNDPAAVGGGYNFANLMAGDIERIEVLRGAQSILWGSQAIGGVVNIITADPEKPLEASASAEGGSFGTGYGMAGVGGKSERATWRIAGNYLTTEGVSSYARGTERDGYKNGGVSGRGRFFVTDAVGVEVRAVYSHGHNKFDGFPAPAFTFADTREYGTNREFIGYGGLTAETFDGRMKSRIAFTYTDNKRLQTNPDQTVTQITFDSRGQNRHWEYQGSLAIADGWTAIFGAESEKSQMRSASPTSTVPNPASIRGTVNINSGYAQLQGEIVTGLTLTGGLRHDSHDTFGGRTVGQAAAAWSFNDGATVLRVSWGEGFKAPTLYQLYSNFGNTNLKPEQATSWDGGIEQHFGVFTLSATGFARTNTNQIDFISCTSPNINCTPGRTGVYDNLTRTKARGVELAGAVEWEQLALQTNYTYTDTENDAVGNVNRGKVLARRPKHVFNMSATYTWPIRLTTGVNVRYVDDAFDDAANRNVLRHYTLVDLRASFAVTPNIDLYGRIENVLDRQYQTTLNYGSLGRGAYAGVRAHF